MLVVASCTWEVSMGDSIGAGLVIPVSNFLVLRSLIVVSFS